MNLGRACARFAWRVAGSNLLIDRDIPVFLLTRVTHECVLATDRRVASPTTESRGYHRFW